MDGCALSSLVPSWDQLVNIAATLGTIVTLASAAVAATPPPPPGTRLAKLYRVIEFLAIVVRRAKETGALPQSRAERAVADAVALATESRNSR
jgi:hypothetical protein